MFLEKERENENGSHLAPVRGSRDAGGKTLKFWHPWEGFANQSLTNNNNKKHHAGLASPYIHPEGFVFTWTVHPLSSPYRGFRRDGLTVVHISSSGEFLLSGGAGSGVGD